MANLDVALRLRLVNDLKPGAAEARRDLENIGTAARRIGGSASGIAAVGTAAGRLGTALTATAAAGTRADASLRRIAAERAGLAGVEAGAQALGQGLDRTGTAAKRAGDGLRGLAGARGGLDANAAAAGKLADNLARAAAIVPRVRLSPPPNTAPWGERPTGPPPRAPAPPKPPAPRPPVEPPAELPRTGRMRRRRRDAMEDAGSEIAMAAGVSRLGPVGVGAAAAYGTGRSYVDFADVERRMTRIGITADATRTEMRTVTREAQGLANAYAVPFDQVVSGYEALAAQGRKMGDIRAFMPSVTATAQASGASVEDIANTAGAIGDQMQIAAPRMQAAFDVLVAGGKAGKFELKDMARYLPSLAPAAAAIGYKGEEGLRRLVAIAQVVRNQTGTAEEAAASLNNILGKMTSDETVKNFKEMGVADLRGELDKARREGRDLITVFTELADKALKGDHGKLPQLVADQEFRRGVLALLSQKGAVDRMVESLRKADGSTLTDLSRVLEDNRAKVDRLSAAWERFKTTVGGAVAPGLSERLERMAERIGAVSRQMDDIDKRRAVQAAGQPAEDKPEGDLLGRLATKTIDGLGAGKDALLDRLIAPLPTEDRARQAAEDAARRGETAREGAEKARAEAAELEGRAKAEKTKAQRRYLEEQARSRRGEADRLETERAARGRDVGAHAARDMTDVEKGEAAARLSVETRRRIRDLEAALAATDRPNVRLPGGLIAGRQGVEAEVATLRKRMEQLGATPAAPPPPAPQPPRGGFGLAGPTAPEATGPGGTIPRTGTQAMPLAPDLGKAFDPQPMILGMRQATEEAGKLRTALAQDLAEPARTSMQSYTGALQAGAEAAIAVAKAAAAQILAALTVTATPTIAPRLVPPAGGATVTPSRARGAPASTPAAPRLQTAGLRRRGGGGSTFTGPIHVHGVRDVASLEREVRRAADRRARDERDNALHDTGLESA